MARTAPLFRINDPTGDAFFEHQLALELGMTKQEMRMRMTAREYTEWKAFFIERADRENEAIKKAQRGRS